MIQLKNYIRTIGFAITVLLIVFFVNPFNLGFFFGYGLIVFLVLKKKFLLREMDLNFVLLFLISNIYALFYSFDPVGGVQFSIIYAVFPPFFYLIGKYLIIDKISAKGVFNILVMIGFVFSFTALVSVLLNLLEGGFAQLDRSLPIFWSGRLITATRMGAFFTLNMCIPALLIGTQGKFNFFTKIIVLLIFTFSLICVIRLGSRTQLGIMLITSFIALFYVIPKQSLKKNILLFLVLITISFFIYNNVSFDINADWLSTFAGRMDKGAGDITSGGGRTERWRKSIEYLFERPMGWSVNEFGFSHNLWLDVLRVSGIIPFILLLIFSLRSFLILKKTVKINPNDTRFSVLIITYGVAFFLLFMVEPIFEGMFTLFLVFCIFMGTVFKYNVTQLQIS